MRRSGLLFVALAFFALASFATYCAAQPWNSIDGNPQSSNSELDQVPLTADEAATVRLRWRLANISAALEPLIGEKASEFEYFSSPVTIDPRSKLFVFASRSVPHCPGSTYQCAYCHVVALDAATGKALDVSKKNVSWTYGNTCLETGKPLLSLYKDRLYVVSAVGDATQDWTVTVYHPDDLQTILWRHRFLYSDCQNLIPYPTRVLENRDGSSVYMATTCAVYAFDAATGSPQWRQNFVPVFKTSDTASSAHAYLWSSQGAGGVSDTNIIAQYSVWSRSGSVSYNLADGSVAWANSAYPFVPLEAQYYPAPAALGGNSLIFSTSSVSALTLQSMDVSNGNITWTFTKNLVEPATKNFAVSPSIVTTFLGSISSTMPLYAFTTTGLYRHVWVNGTTNTGFQCDNVFLVQPTPSALGMAYAICDVSGYAFGVDIATLKVQWGIYFPEMSEGVKNSVAYLGRGVFAHRGYQRRHSEPFALELHW